MRAKADDVLESSEASFHGRLVGRL